MFKWLFKKNISIINSSFLAPTELELMEQAIKYKNKEKLMLIEKNSPKAFSVYKKYFLTNYEEIMN